MNRHRWLNPRLLSSLALVFPVTVLLLILFAPGFFQLSNGLNIARQGAMLALVTFGMSLALIGGGIDLSVGAVMSLSSVTLGLLLTAGLPAPVALLAGVATGAACGLVNGIAVGYLNLPPFIATFGMAGMAGGLALVLTDGRTLSGLAGVKFLNGSLLGIPVPLWVVGGALLLLELAMRRTPFGVWLYAVGGNAEAARLAGIDVKRHRLLTFALSGMLAGLAGALMAGRMLSANPTAGEGYDFDAVAAAVVGGVSIAGGRGRIAEALAGAAYIATLRNGMNLMGFPFSLQIVGVGLVILLTFLMEAGLQRLRNPRPKEVASRAA